MISKSCFLVPKECCQFWDCLLMVSRGILIMVVRNFLVGTLLRETCWLRERRMKSSRLVVRIKGEEGSVIWDLRIRKILSWFVWILKICTLQAMFASLRCFLSFRWYLELMLGCLTKVMFFFVENDFSKLLFKVIPLLSNSSLLGRMDEKIMWDSGCLVWISSTVSVAFFMSVSFVSECSKSFVPEWIMKDLGEVYVVLFIIDFACARVAHRV